MMIKRLAHACLFSTDLDRTEKFYCGVLGLRIKFPFMKGERRIGFYLEMGELQFIEVFARESSLRNVEPFIGHVCLETDDIKGLTARLHEQGVATQTPEPIMGSDGSWQIWCKDPDGTHIEFHQYTPGSSQYTGQTCIAHWL